MDEKEFKAELATIEAEQRKLQERRRNARQARFVKAQRDQRAERRAKMSSEEIAADASNDEIFASVFDTVNGRAVLETLSASRPIVAEEIKERLNRVAAKTPNNAGKEKPD